MKRSFVLVAMAFLLVGSLAFGEKAVLIDFSSLDADIVADENGKPTVNKRTVMDFSKVSSISFDDTQKALMRTSLALTDWEVQLNSSARIVANMQHSIVKSAPVISGPFQGKNVMGVRVVFPTAPVNANARIMPAFDIPAFEPMADIDENGQVVEGSQKPNAYRFRKNGDDQSAFGVLDNVGTLKSVSLTTYGYNYPHAVYVLLKDNDNVERRYYMGTLNFDGWKNLIWNNPDYITDIRNREIKVYPLYPRGLPYAKLSGIYITRDAAHDGGDFVAYFKQIDVIYDKAVAQTERDIADEDLWGIVTAKERIRQTNEMRRFGSQQVNRFIEKSNLAKEEDFTSTVTGTNQQQ
ncbi:flagellar filament outer layer protein FlaA [Treponema maltophilum]|uniref:flagellar filament outer layer protein FlaA n=1 Tax=Treponema maltophilum TaxID=51160 RepID=UPI003D93467C